MGTTRFSNTTVISLQLSQLATSPFFSAANSKNYYKLSFDNCKYFRSFSSFYKSFANLQHAKFSRSVFVELQDSAIYINQKTLPIFRRYINTTVRIDENITFSDVNVTNSVFKGVKCKENGGGAITMLSKTCQLRVMNSGFTLCYSNKDGAGIDVEGFLLEVNQTCFLGCLSLESGQAIYMAGEAVDKNSPYGSVYYTSIEQCSPALTRGSRESIFLSRGTAFAAFLNNTANHINEFGSCFVSAFTQNVNLYYSNFVECTGGNGFWFHVANDKDNLKFCNVIHITAKKETGIITFEKCSSSVNLVGWVFKGNKCPVYFVTGPVTLRDCVFDVKKTNYMFQRCEYELINTVFNQGADVSTRYVNNQVTWGCWAFGRPSPTPSKSLPPIEVTAEEATSGSVLFVIVLFIGGMFGVSVFCIFNKTEEMYAEHGMSGVDIGD